MLTKFLIYLQSIHLEFMLRYMSNIKRISSTIDAFQKIVIGVVTFLANFKSRPDMLFSSILSRRQWTYSDLNFLKKLCDEYSIVRTMIDYSAPHLIYCFLTVDRLNEYPLWTLSSFKCFMLHLYTLIRDLMRTRPRVHINIFLQSKMDFACHWKWIFIVVDRQKSMSVKIDFRLQNRFVNTGPVKFLPIFE